MLMHWLLSYGGAVLPIVVAATHEEDIGHAFVFPSGQQHRAVNASPDRERLILYCEFYG